MEKGLQTSPFITIGISACEGEKENQLGEGLRSPHTVETTHPNVSLGFFSARISSMQSSNKIPSLSTSSHVSGMCSFLITPVLSSATEMCLTWRYVAQEVSFGTENERLLPEKDELPSVGGKLTHTVYIDTQTVKEVWLWFYAFWLLLENSNIDAALGFARC